MIRTLITALVAVAAATSCSPAPAQGQTMYHAQHPAVLRLMSLNPGLGVMQAINHLRGRDAVMRLQSPRGSR